jgi:vWA-MoxR associated protein C-terminal domain/vWA-MoxR associated protein middle region 0/Effector-associated domain 2
LTFQSETEGGSRLPARTRRDLRNSMTHALRDVPHLVDQLPEILRQIEEDTSHRFVLNEDRTPSVVAFQLVANCARLADGLDALAGVVDGFAHGLDAMNEFSRLVDEWYALGSMHELEAIWPRLKAELKAFPDGRMTSLYRRAIGPRPADLPHHCTTVWDAFVRLVNRPADPQGLPPWLTLLRLVRPEMSAGGGPELDEELDRITSAWQSQGLLSQAEDSVASSGVADNGDTDGTGGIVIVRIVPDSLDEAMFTLSHGILIGEERIAADRGDDRLVARGELEARVEQILKRAESTWASRLDDIDVEFLLPLALINEPVEWWGKDLSVPPENRSQLAQYYGIVVRSIDRLTDRSLHRLWRKRWNRLHRHADECHVTWADSTRAEHLRRLEAELVRDENCVGLVLSRPPNPGDGINQEFAIALRAGLPLILWHRDDCERPDFRQIASMIVDSPLMRLPVRASRLRRQIGELTTKQRNSQAAMGLAFIWDDASRLADTAAASGLEASG